MAPGGSWPLPRGRAVSTLPQPRRPVGRRELRCCGSAPSAAGPSRASCAVNPDQFGSRDLSAAAFDSGWRLPAITTSVPVQLPVQDAGDPLVGRQVGGAARYGARLGRLLRQQAVGASGHGLFKSRTGFARIRAASLPGRLARSLKSARPGAPSDDQWGRVACYAPRVALWCSFGARTLRLPPLPMREWAARVVLGRDSARCAKSYGCRDTQRPGAAYLRASTRSPLPKPGDRMRKVEPEPTTTPGYAATSRRVCRAMQPEYAGLSTLS
jgi:hypothetical protein